MGYKFKRLGPLYRDFATTVGPLNLTAGVPIAEIFLGMYGHRILAAVAGNNISAFLQQLSEITVTRAGQTIVSIEHGQDLLALMRAPWLDQTPDLTDGVSSDHYLYCKGLNLPCAYPPGAAGEFQLTLENTDTANTDEEKISITEGQGLYAQNYFGQGILGGQVDDKNYGPQHFHIVKRLKTPSAAWEDFNIGTEGTLIGLMLWQTDEESKTKAYTAVNFEEIKLEIGGETVILTDYLAALGTQGSFGGAESNTRVCWPSAILSEYIYFDFRRQPWDCRGKSVILSWNDSELHAIRAYPIYLVNWGP